LFFGAPLFLYTLPLGLLFLIRVVLDHLLELGFLLRTLVLEAEQAFGLLAPLQHLIALQLLLTLLLIQ
jgi:hypothetical protein